jgi:hypothetical protein
MRAALKALVVMAVLPAVLRAQAAPKDSTEAKEQLAKKLANPVSDLVSIPFQFNWQEGVGPDKGNQFILNIQPVVPLPVSEKWNLIGRWIMPIISQPALTPGGPTAEGMGDILWSTFLSPAHPKRAIWGVGPALSLPVSSNPMLGTGKWSVGPTFVVLKQQKEWTYGILWNQIWSIAGDSGRGNVSQMFTQPFIAHTSKSSLTWTLNAEASTNWEAASGQQWSIPINLMVSKVAPFGPFPASYQFGLGYYVVHPDDGPTWKIRLNFALLLPTRKK